MQERQITIPVVLDVLRKGVINRVPESNIKTGFTECKVERFCAGRNIGAVVALQQEEASSCLVVTAFIIGE